VNKLSASGSALVYSTYLGGTGQDSGQGIAVDSAGNAYIVGATYSTDFPTMNPLQPTLGGTSNAFVSKLNASGSALVYSTYLGGSGSDGGYGIAVDSAGDAYVTGSTPSTNFPTMNPLQPANAGGGDAFVTRLNASGSALVYSTYLGGSADDNGVGIAVDSSGNVYVTGDTTSTNFPTVNPLQPANGGGSDAFVAKFPATGIGADFSISAATGNNCPTGGNCSTSATVTAGQTATYNLQVSPVNGFNGTVTLSCGDALAKSTCSVSPSSVTVNGTAASALTVTITTTAASMLGPYSTPASRRPSVPLVLPLLLVLAVALIVAESAVARNPRRRLVPALALLALSLVWIGGCGGGSSSGGGGGNTGTPSGTVTVTGTSSGVSHSLSLTVTVD
jgi:Beta-propeller repeat